MPKIVTEDIGNFSHHYPKVAVIITASARGRDDAMTAAWHSSISLKPPLYGIAIASKRFTYQLITESQEFGINFIPSEKASLAAAIGGISGQQVDKFERFNIKKEKPLKTAAPILKDAYAAYECKLVDSKPYGDHLWIVGEIVAVHLLEEAFTPAGVLNLNKIKPLLYLSSDFYASTDKNSIRLIERGI
ncbi:MAG: flavin reductase family protein [Chloroflexota bacterium]|nr:flavin reductase family protein [Chloroflexota bacterium]